MTSRDSHQPGAKRPGQDPDFGWLGLSPEDAFEVMESLKSTRWRMLVARRELHDDGYDKSAKYYDDRLEIVRGVRRRLLVVINKKGWDIAPHNEE